MLFCNICQQFSTIIFFFDSIAQILTCFFIHNRDRGRGIFKNAPSPIVAYCYPHFSHYSFAIPGFLYDIEGRYYYLGKWICKECTDTEATDCVTMYHMCRNGHEEPDTNLYFQKIRAFSDFALDIPYNPAQIEENMAALTAALTDAHRESLARQIAGFEEDMEKYCQ